MASKFPAEKDEKVELRTIKGHDMAWSCDKHPLPIAFYCKEHSLPVCDRCAINEHCQKSCKLDGIEDVISERRRKLDEKQHEIEEIIKQLQALDSKLESTATSASNHFQSVNDKLKVAFEDKLKSVKDKEDRAIRLLNEQVDGQIHLINEKREKRIKSFNEEAEQQELIINESQAKVESKTKAISEFVAKEIQDLTSKNQHAINILDNIDSKIKRIKQDDKTLVNEAHQVLAPIDDNSNLNVHQDVSDCLDRIQSEVERVKFVEGEVGGRIDGCIGKWEFVKSIQIPSIVNVPTVCGLISDDEICVRDVRNQATYVTNIRTEHTQQLIAGYLSIYHITSCTPLDSSVIVCGKCRAYRTGDSLDGCITLYDRQWKVIREINIPRNTRYYIADVYIDVDRDGMILAAQSDQSNIYVINPTDGKIINTITMQSKVVRGEIQALSSGDIVVKTGRDEHTVISRSGEEKAVIHCAEWSRCRVDKLTDTLYITYWDDERTIYAMDQVSCDGIIQAKRIVQYEKSDRCSVTNPCLVTPSGNLLACNGETFFVQEEIYCISHQKK